MTTKSLLSKSIAGNVDAFSAGVLTDGNAQRDFTGGEIILFEKVLLNIQNSYSPDTGNDFTIYLHQWYFSICQYLQ